VHYLVYKTHIAAIFISPSLKQPVTHRLLHQVMLFD